MLLRLRSLWSARPAVPDRPVPFEVACACGQVASGWRKAEHQVIRCAGCGQELFVLPLSPLPPVQAGDRRAAAGAGSLGKRLRPWLLPLTAVGLTIAALVAVYLVVFTWGGLGRPSPSPAKNGPAQETVQAFAQRLETAQKLMRQGQFRLAVEELRAAQGVGVRLTDSVPATVRRQWRQLYRQAELLADLTAESLEEILRHAAGVQEREWLADFEHRYRGKAVVFDLEIRRVEPGRYEHPYVLRLHEERAHLELGDLQLLERLPLTQAQRVVFGGRLAGVRREPGRGWVVRLEPDSGVLLTDLGALAACLPDPDGPPVQALRDRQVEWITLEPPEARPGWQP